MLPAVRYLSLQKTSEYICIAQIIQIKNKNKLIVRTAAADTRFEVLCELMYTPLRWHQRKIHAERWSTP